MWASGKGVDKDTQAKAAAAVAEWEKLRAKAHTKSAAKKVAASAAGHVLCLANGAFNVDIVRQAWDAQARAWERSHAPDTSAAAAAGGEGSNIADPGLYVDAYIKELWTDHLIVQNYDGDLFRVDYTVGDPDNDNDTDVTFDDPVPVRVEYVTIDPSEMVGSDIDDDTLRTMAASMPPCYGSSVDKVLLSISSTTPSAAEAFLGLTAPVGPARSALQKVLALADDSKGQYGDVPYADVKNKKYPIDTAAHCRAAWSYINMPKNQKGYSPAEVSAIKAKIKAAAKRFGVDISED